MFHLTVNFELYNSLFNLISNISITVWNSSELAYFFEPGIRLTCFINRIYCYSFLFIFARNLTAKLSTKIHATFVFFIKCCFFLWFEIINKKLKVQKLLIISAWDISIAGPQLIISHFKLVFKTKFPSDPQKIVAFPINLNLFKCLLSSEL